MVLVLHIQLSPFKKISLLINIYFYWNQFGDHSFNQIDETSELEAEDDITNSDVQISKTPISSREWEESYIKIRQYTINNFRRHYTSPESTKWYRLIFLSYISWRKRSIWFASTFRVRRSLQARQLSEVLYIVKERNYNLCKRWTCWVHHSQWLASREITTITKSRILPTKKM